jgi:copper transport protein
MLAATATLAAVAAAAPSAWGHARLVRTEPGDGAVLAHAPARVALRFDDAVRVLGGTVVVRNSDRRSVLDGKPRGSGPTVVVPLRKLSDGDYTVRWRVLSDDGHTLEGVFAFAVGAGRSPPSAALSVESEGPSATNVLSRWLFFAGLLVAVGVAVFLLLAWRPALRAAGAGTEDGSLWGLLFGGFFLAFLGAAGLVPHGGVGTTRFGLLVAIGGVVAVAGATLAAIAIVERRVGRLVFAAAILLLPVPSLAGHALDRGQIRPLNVIADVIHVGAAAVWIGGLLALAVGLPRTARRLEPEQRARFTAVLVPRLSAAALVSVALIGATGLVRILSELSAVSQLWSSGYGRALLVKTGLLVALVTLGWVNRSRLVPDAVRRGRAAGALRRNVIAELALLAGIVTAVAFLTDLAPGRQLARALARPKTPIPRPVRPPPAGATVLAAQAGDLAVGLALLPNRTVRATVIGPDSYGADGLTVSFRTRGRAVGSTACGPGCYRSDGAVPGSRVTVSLGSSRTVAFKRPANPRSASILVGRARRAFTSLRSVVIHERLASSPRARVSSTWRIAAPNRLAYVTSEGSQGIVIGARRWDRSRNTPWQPSPQTPLRLPGAWWGARWLDAKAIGWTSADGRRARVVSFYDPKLPAWFEVALDPRSALPLELRMTAAAHFMHHRYTDFNRPLRIVPPA